MATFQIVGSDEPTDDTSGGPLSSGAGEGSGQGAEAAFDVDVPGGADDDGDVTDEAVGRRVIRGRPDDYQEANDMAKDHGSSVKNDKQYEGLRKKGMSKGRAAAISNSEGSSSRGGKKSGSGSSSKSNSSQGGTSQQKKAAGRKGGKAAANKS
jgi:hypothetical protein